MGFSELLKRRVLCCLILPSLFLLVAGCGGPGYRLAPVSGRVTLDGKAVPGAHVVFQPVAHGERDPNPGPGSHGLTDAEGRFVLETAESARPGAVVGEHVVRIRSGRPEAERDDVGSAAPDPLPPASRDGSLRFTVPAGGTSEADFALTWR